MSLEVQVLDWYMHTIVAGLNRLMGSQSFLLDNWISKDKIYTLYMYKKKRFKNTHSLPLKKTTYYHKNGEVKTVNGIRQFKQDNISVQRLHTLEMYSSDVNKCTDHITQFSNGYF